MVKRIGVLTSGGDSPGMNAAIRAVVRQALDLNFSVAGILRGYNGMLDCETVEMERGSVGDIIHRGGTVLHTARSERFITSEGQKLAVENAAKLGIDGLVVIGGDGSFRGAQALHRLGLPVIGVPATIDNDINCTDYSIGFDTAVNTVIDAVNKIRDTAASHERVSIVEVMGRECGAIALMAGLAGGAESIIIPEYDTSMEEVCRRIEQGRQRGKRHSIIIVAEGAMGGFEAAKKIKELIGLETRVTVLGHIQRGGNPSAMDRILATILGAEAVKLLAKGESNKMVGMVGSKVVVSSLNEAVQKVKRIDGQIYALASILAK